MANLSVSLSWYLFISNFIFIKILNFDCMGMIGKIRSQMWLVLILLGLALVSFILIDMM